MKIRLRDLRKIVREALFEKKSSNNWGRSSSEDEEEGLLDDPAYDAKSVYVPDDVKTKINKWTKQMRLTQEKK
jgi:hypothetical protein